MDEPVQVSLTGGFRIWGGHNERPATSAEHSAEENDLTDSATFDQEGGTKHGCGGTKALLGLRGKVCREQL